MVCECGNNKFYAHQQFRANITVDGSNFFDDVTGNSLDLSIYDTGEPYGPYECTKCGKAYDELPEDIVPDGHFKCSVCGNVIHYPEDTSRDCCDECL
jgi:DNA-directed RNA polymerase subunit RPC12/RpoP|tara:strand:- start:2807 stop:3097 length:291 start_codon:yes stop_codon:yes gene_type:complete